MAFVILDPGLHMIAGHHFELDTALLEAASARGVSGHIFCHRTDNPHLNDHPSITPFFDVLGRATTRDPILTDLDRYLLENEGVYRDLNRLSDVVDMEDAIIFYATARLHSLTGLGRWAREWRLPPRHLFVLLPEYFIFALQGSVGTLDQLFYRYGFAQFPSGEPSRISFLTLSKRQVAEYGGISGREIIQAPYPVGEVSGTLSAKPSVFAPSSRLRVVVCGTSRNSKGFDLLPAVIRQVMNARSDVEFVVQYCPTEDVSAEATALVGSGATIIEGYLDRESYHGLIRSADIVFLPYMGPGYRIQTSAVFSEARWFGRPTIVSAETSMSDDIDADPRLGLAASPDPQAFASAIGTMLDGYPAFARAAAEASVPYRREHGTARLVELMIGRA